MQGEAEERRAAILALALGRGPTTVSELADRFTVSASTIRRDLARLAADGHLSRTYGGAMATSRSVEPSLADRTTDHYDAKAGIGAWAAGQVRRGESIFLDAGSTAALVARALTTASGITVITPSLTVVETLADRTAIEVIGIGGTLRRASRAFVGPLADAAIERLTFDRAFLSADGVTPDLGICEADSSQARVKELVDQRARRTYVLAHAAKLGARPFHAWTSLAAGWTLVSDSEASPDQVAMFVSAGVRTCRVDAKGELLD